MEKNRQVKCPKCGSDNVNRSHRRGIEKYTRYLSMRKPYRCKECLARFFYAPGIFGSPFAVFSGALLILILFAAGAYLMFKPDQKSVSVPKMTALNNTGSPVPGSLPAAPKTKPDKPGAMPVSPPDPLVSKPDGKTGTGPVPNPPVPEPSGLHTQAEPADTGARPSRPDLTEKEGMENLHADEEEKDTSSQPVKADSGQEKAQADARVQPSLEDDAQIRMKKKTAPEKQFKQSESLISEIRFKEEENAFHVYLATEFPISSITQEIYTSDGIARYIAHIPGKWSERGGPGVSRTYIAGDHPLVWRVRIGSDSKEMRVVFDLKKNLTQETMDSIVLQDSALDDSHRITLRVPRDQ